MFIEKILLKKHFLPIHMSEKTNEILRLTTISVLDKIKIFTRFQCFIINWKSIGVNLVHLVWITLSVQSSPQLLTFTEIVHRYDLKRCLYQFSKLPRWLINWTESSVWHINEIDYEAPQFLHIKKPKTSKTRDNEYQGLPKIMNHFLLLVLKSNEMVIICYIYLCHAKFIIKNHRP